MGKMYWVRSYLACPDCNEVLMLENQHLIRRLAATGDKLRCLKCGWSGVIASKKKDGRRVTLVLVADKKHRTKKPQTKKGES